MKNPMISSIIIIFFLSTYANKSMIMSMNNMSDHCPAQVCNYEDPITVRFPFLIENKSLPGFCGYPGFDLFCDGSDKLSIHLPNSGIFSVQTIDYVKQQLWLNDPDNCLPRRLLSVNHLSNYSGNYNFSPFIATQQRVYWLYNCSSDYFKSVSNFVKPIGCLSGQSYGVFAALSEMTTSNSTTSVMCRTIGSIRVPVGSLEPYEMDYSDLISHIRVSWIEPECGECFQGGGHCGFTSNSSLEVGCFNLPHPGLSKNAILAIGLAFTAPLALSIVCIAYLVTRAICYRSRRRENEGVVTLAQEMGLQPHQTHVNNSGLDESTIESYPKVVLGESRRLPKSDDKSCPICLGEYLAKDTLRTLPHCAHSFHAQCVDEWLRLNSSCPVCRTSPSQ